MIFIRYKCYFYESPTGQKPVEDFIASLGEQTQDKFIFKRGLLECFGPELRSPHTKPVGNDMFELRFRGGEGQVRILFFFFLRGQIILVHGFIKKSQKTPKKELKIALKRMKEYLLRKHKLR